MRYFFVTILILSSLSLGAQTKQVKTRLRTVDNGVYTEKFRVLASDTSCRHGDYQMIYKNRVVEKGPYKKGVRSGEWFFWGLENQLEFVYDYDNQALSKVLPHDGHVYTSRTLPCLFLGSPLIPHLFICRRVFYPVKEHGTSVDCQVILSLKVNSRGRMTGYELVRESKPAFNKAVLDAAAQIPKSWRWVPARDGGRFIDSDYRITIIFDASN